MVRILWLCTHRTQWREEVPLLLEAGFEVIPCKLGHKESPANEDPDDPYYIQTWRRRCSLPGEEIDQIRSINWFHEAPPAMVDLANRVFDGVILTSFSDSLLLIARWFSKPILFRTFGHAGLTSYSEILSPNGLMKLIETAAFRENRYCWCPIISTLRHAEHQNLTRNEVVLEPFVSPDRLPVRWQATNVNPYVALVLSRVADVGYYGKLYGKIASCFRTGPEAIPLRILGQNQPGTFGDSEILGSLPDRDFYEVLAGATALFYPGNSLCHLHWCALEAWAMGVPVVVLRQGYLAWALGQLISPQAMGQDYGVVEGLDDARSLLAQCLRNPGLACRMAERQRPLAEYITDHERAVRQYRERLEAILGPANQESGQVDFPLSRSA